MPFNEAAVTRDGGGRFSPGTPKPEGSPDTITSRRVTRTGMDREIAKMYYPVHKAVAALRGNEVIGMNTWFNMDFAIDPEEAAHFLEQDWALVESAGLPEASMKFLRGFLREFGS